MLGFDFNKMISKKVIKSFMPALKKFIQNMVEKGKEIPLEPGEAAPAALFMEVKGKPYFMLVIVKEDGHSFSRVLMAIPVEELMSAEMIEKLDLDDLGLDLEDMEKIFDDE